MSLVRQLRTLGRIPAMEDDTVEKKRLRQAAYRMEMLMLENKKRQEQLNAAYKRIELLKSELLALKGE